MSPSNILIGGDSFRKIRDLGCYYVDKTGFLIELLSQTPPEVSLITRPRRFGKTLNMTMLQEFFDIRQDSMRLFEGLAISKNKAICEAWMNKYPSVFLSMKNVEGMSFDEAYIYFRALAARLCSDHAYLIDSPRVAELEKNLLKSILEEDADTGAVSNILLTLCRALHGHWNKPVILLIDEYDVPLASAEQNGYYDEMVSFIRNMLGAALKTNPSLQFGILTGCLRIAKESIFTGLNNFKSYGISDVRFSDKFGFTSQEVDALLADANFSDKKAVMREWYDGYCFGLGQEIYCPWDILQYVDDLQDNPNALPKAYWSNTSSNSIVRKFIGRTDLNIGNKFETLIEGGCVETKIVENLTYDSMHSSEDNLWSLLYLTGYLTKASEEQLITCGKLSDEEKSFLVIPNKEVKKIFTETIASWFDESIQKMDRQPLFDAFWSGNNENLSRIISRILLNSISYHDYKEDFYHAVLAGIFVGSGYVVSSNSESGLGRADIIIRDTRNSQAAVIEVKHANSMGELASLTDTALNQINEKKYDAPLLGNYETVIHWGMAFFQKKCLAKFETVTSI